MHEYVTSFFKSIRYFTFCLLLFCCIFFYQPLEAIAEEAANDTETTIKEPDDLYAQSAVLMDADSGRILFEKNGQTELAMASTTKIMTCILALEYGNLDDIVTVSKNASAQPAVHLGVHEGQQFKLEDLLYSLMLESHNDSAVIIAESIGTSEEGFADMMNQKAKDIGCTNTYFITANGLDADDINGSHHTTAKDLAKIMKYCIMNSPKKELFLEITQTPEYSFTDISGTSSFHCTNHNSFLNMMEGALSGKTGYTNEAGYCYVGALENEGRTFIVSLLACGWPNNKGYKWSDTRTLMKYGIENFHYRNIYQAITLNNLKVINGVPDNNKLMGTSTVPLFIEMPSSLQISQEINLLLRDDQEINIVIKKEDSILAPVMSGKEVGSITYFLDTEELYSWKIVTADSKSVRNVQWCSQQLLSRYLLKNID